MNTEKDYYAILGVLPTAEDAVIRAAYKVLAQRYHPDRFCGEEEASEKAHRKMVEINEAWSVLSDKQKRKEYDGIRGEGIKSGENYFNDSDDDGATSNDPLYRDWQVAIEYYPELIDLEGRLRKISWKLAYTYKVWMLELKQYESMEEIANRLEQQFMETYFGTNKKILSFARLLISNGNKSAAKKLNMAVRVLGSDIKADRVIDKIRYGLTEKGGFEFEISRIDEEDAKGYTPLMKAAREGDVNLVRNLVALGANPKLKEGTFGIATALSMAIATLNRTNNKHSRKMYQTIIDILTPIT